MNKHLQAVILSTSGALAAGCVVPPPVYERASWGTPQQTWQEQGRFRQAPDPALEQQQQKQPPPAPRPVEQPTTSFDPTLAPPATATPEPVPPPLYAWDGGVVDGAPQGRVIEQAGTPRGVEAPPAGRMHIIELYQQVLDERDALAGEVERLRASLDETTRALEARTLEAQDLTARLSALEASYQALSTENHDVASRLVQAQIRRLEAEKLLLETRIDLERSKAEEAARAAAAQAKPLKNRAPRGEPSSGEGEKP